MQTLIRRIWADDSGQGLSEYALIIAVVALGVMAALIVMREEIIGTFRGASNGMETTPAGQTN
jgi:pilus assembly protein Flp/PilA